MKFEIPATFTLGGVEHVVEIQQEVGYNQDFGQYDPVRKVISRYSFTSLSTPY